MIRKLQNIFEFFKTTLTVNLLVCIIAVFFGGLDYFFIFFLSFGFLASLCFKEFYRKNDYLFYVNNGVSKIQLLICSYFMTFCTSILLGLVIFLKGKLF
jgi:hypothetical protein